MHVGTAARQDLPGIQILRGIAALIVALHHIMSASAPDDQATYFGPPWLTWFGAGGVDIFFVISGFIMVYVSFDGDRATTRPADFLVRRVKRIYPFYWLCYAAGVVVVAAGFQGSLLLTPHEYVTAFLLLPGDKRLLAVSWTLVFEMYFYLIFALMLMSRSRWKSIVGTCVALGVLLLAARLPARSVLIDFLSNPIALEFCFGMLLAWAFTQAPRWRFGLRAGLAGAALIVTAPVLFVPMPLDGMPSNYRPLYWGLPAVLIVAAFLNAGRGGGRVVRSAIALGDASYALYLTHMFVVLTYSWSLRHTALQSIDKVILIPAVLAGTVVVGLMAHRFVEKPLLRLIRKMSQARPGRSEPLHEPA